MYVQKETNIHVKNNAVCKNRAPEKAGYVA